MRNALTIKYRTTANRYHNNNGTYNNNGIIMLHNNNRFIIMEHYPNQLQHEYLASLANPKLIITFLHIRIAGILLASHMITIMFVNCNHQL